MVPEVGSSRERDASTCSKQTKVPAALTNDPFTWEFNSRSLGVHSIWCTFAPESRRRSRNKRKSLTNAICCSFLIQRQRQADAAHPNGSVCFWSQCIQTSHLMRKVLSLCLFAFSASQWKTSTSHERDVTSDRCVTMTAVLNPDLAPISCWTARRRHKWRL